MTVIFYLIIIILLLQGRKYSDDSVYINDEMNDFTERTRKLHKVINKLVESVSNITTVIEDSARGIGNAGSGNYITWQERCKR